MTFASIANHSYARQSVSQHKHSGGVGRCRKSFWKHDKIKKYLGRLLPVLSKRSPGLRGLIIDMHAGDGEATPHPQPDMFAGGALITTPHLAIAMAEKWRADVWLCERSHAPRKALRSNYGGRARIFGNHHQLLNHADEIRSYPWVIVINDPNGHSDASNGVSVMQAIAETNPVSDFIIVCNHRSIRRHLGVGKKDNSKVPLALAVQATAGKYEWMLTPDNWKERLGKRQVMATEPMTLSPEMTAQVLLVSNFIPGYRP